MEFHVDIGPQYEGEVIRKEDMHVEFGGPKAKAKFELVTLKNPDEIEHEKVEVIGPDLKDMPEGSSYPIAILIDMAGEALEKYMEPVIERRMHKYEVVGVCEPAAALEPDIPRAELIVALVPYEHPRLPTLHIGPFLTGEEIRAIRSWLAAKESEERRAALSQPAKLGIVELPERSSIVFQTGTMDWRRSVVLAAEPLIHAAKITPSYVKAMIQIVDEFGPYMILAPGVILLHAKPSDGVNSLCFSLLVHRDGINFGSPLGKVHVLFVLGAVDNQSHLTALFQLSNLLQTAGFVQKL